MLEVKFDFLLQFIHRMAKRDTEEERKKATANRRIERDPPGPQPVKGSPNNTTTTTNTKKASLPYP
jgi:hypothetical protein